MLQKILPIGFTYPETRCRKFEVNKIDGFMERIIHNEQLKAEKTTEMDGVTSVMLASRHRRQVCV